MTFRVFVISGAVFAAICLAFAAAGHDLDPVNAGIAAFLSAVAGTWLAA